ncbi:class I SAM-dependent methyltransferase [Vulgatibacter sp.]|uniref:class I SAM-dependent methyltransferase n=1 Tax=Vulgatibacter sp. TaxID=1971226 RepID=UPI00356A9F44
MGRRDVPVEADRWVFNRLAAAYRARPGYPAALIDRLVAAAGGGPVADLGAGTGHLALPLARAGLAVAAVEPARAMREALAAQAVGLEVEAVAAAAESTPLPAGHYGLVVVADALHWIDPERAGREAARLLRADGSAAVIEPVLDETPFLDELRALLARYNPKARARPAASRGRQLLALALPGAAPVEERFTQQVRLDAAGLEAVLRSLSFVGPALGPADLRRLLAEAADLAMLHGGAVWSRTIHLTGAGPGFAGGRALGAEAVER